jgi:ankyrin repeat protein
LREFPKALDETYERALRIINQKKWEYAYRIFQCLTVSARPLRVEELAEIFTIEVDTNSIRIPEINVRWRPKDAEDAVLSACCSLVAVVQLREERNVQFSHFSVRQFLTSDRISNLKDVSYFHVLLEPAHTFLARACLSLLLEPNETGTTHDSPLHSYAAKHWVDHAQFGNVSSIIQEGMERLFDRDEPHFTAWITAYNLDLPREPSQLHVAIPSPLYYAALCGFYDLAKHLLITHPQDVNARGGRLVTPLHAAIDKGHVKVAQLLLQHNADVNVGDDDDQTPLHLAAKRGDLDTLRSLIDRGADPNVQNKDKETPLFLASRMDAARLLCEHGTDMKHKNSLGRTPLHGAAENGHYDIALMLLDYNYQLDVNAPEKDRWTPSSLTPDHSKLALERCADVDACDNMGWTPLHLASQQGHRELVRLLLEHDADAFARDQEDHTFLDMAWASGHKEIINSRYEDGQTALHIASYYEDLKLMQWLIDDCGLKSNAEDEDQETPLFPASRNGKEKATRLLLDAGAKVNHQNWQKMTPLHRASENGHDAVTRLLLNKNAIVDARHVYDWTPLHLASRAGKHMVAKALLNGGANANAKNDKFWTPLHMASQKGHLDVVKLLLDGVADVNARKADGETALHLAAFYGHLEVAQVLLERISNLDVKNETPRDLALKGGHRDIAQLLKPMGPVRERGR